MSWKEIEGYPGYFVSDSGLVRHLEKSMKPSIRENGYEYLNIKHFKRYYVHRLVALAFLPNPNSYKCINHKDGDKRNNDLSNLEWCTHGHNNKHAIDMGLRSVPKGENHTGAKLTNVDVLNIRAMAELKSTRLLATEYNVDISGIRRIINRRIWRHI